MEVRRQLIGRGSRQLRLQPSAWGNPCKISHYGRDLAIRMFRQDLDKENDKGKCKFKAISAHRLACHCRPEQACHGDAIISQFKLFFLRRIVWGSHWGCLPQRR